MQVDFSVPLESMFTPLHTILSLISHMDITDAELRFRNFCNTADQELSFSCESVPLFESDGKYLRHGFSDSMLRPAYLRCPYRSIERASMIEGATIGSGADSHPRGCLP